MGITLALAVGLDSTLLTNKSTWKSSGLLIVSASQIVEAIDLFSTGDFDLVLLGSGLSPKEKERLNSLIRASGSHAPVVCVADGDGENYSFANATFSNEPDSLVARLEQFMARFAAKHAPRSRDGRAY